MSQVCLPYEQQSSGASRGPLANPLPLLALPLVVAGVAVLFPVLERGWGQTVGVALVMVTAIGAAVSCMGLRRFLGQEDGSIAAVLMGSPSLSGGPAAFLGHSVAMFTIHVLKWIVPAAMAMAAVSVLTYMVARAGLHSSGFDLRSVVPMSVLIGLVIASVRIDSGRAIRWLNWLAVILAIPPLVAVIVALVLCHTRQSSNWTLGSSGAEWHIEQDIGPNWPQTIPDSQDPSKRIAYPPPVRGPTGAANFWSDNVRKRIAPAAVAFCLPLMIFLGAMLSGAGTKKPLGRRWPVVLFPTFVICGALVSIEFFDPFWTLQPGTSSSSWMFPYPIMSYPRDDLAQLLGGWLEHPAIGWWYLMLLAGCVLVAVLASGAIAFRTAGDLTNSTRAQGGSFWPRAGAVLFFAAFGLLGAILNEIRNLRPFYAGTLARSPSDFVTALGNAHQSQEFPDLASTLFILIAMAASILAMIVCSRFIRVVLRERLIYSSGKGLLARMAILSAIAILVSLALAACTVHSSIAWDVASAAVVLAIWVTIFSKRQRSAAMKSQPLAVIEVAQSD